MARKSRKSNEISVQVVLSEKPYNVGLYARLSVEDQRKKDSDSIGTQMCLLKQYIERQPNMLLVDEYNDVDQTGTNFKRPGFTCMLEDIRTKKINCIIVKDLSRFGRNYIETGNYLERVFPFMGVRFISINDNYDSLVVSGDKSLIIPLKNLMNEVYAKDISKKVRSQYEIKRKRGDFCGSFAPYGYIKKGYTLVIDELAADVVRQIFKLVIDGYSDLVIADILNYSGIYPPNRHRYEQGILKGDKHKAVHYWYKSVVKRITENKVYLGNLEQGKYKNNFTTGGRIYLPDDEWVISNETHPPIIETEIFEAVKEIRKNRKKQYEATLAKANHPASSENIFKGLVYCSDCNRPMLRHKKVKANGQIDYCFLCPTYEENNKFDCSKRSFGESELITLLHTLIEKQIQTLVDINIIIEAIRKQANYTDRTSEFEIEISKATAKLTRINGFRSSLYEDYKEGILDESGYMLAKNKYKTESQELTDTLDVLLKRKNQHEDILGENKWATALKNITKRKTLNRDLLMSLIESIKINSNNDVSIIMKYHDEYEALLEMLFEFRKEV